MSADTAPVSSDFDIFASRPVQSAILETNEIIYKPVASVEQSVLQFNIPAVEESYTDPNIRLYVRGKITKEDGSALPATDHTACVNLLLHSLFTQVTILLNGVTITQASDLNAYRAVLETLLTFGTDAAMTHLTNAYWYLDGGNMLACDMTKPADTDNPGFKARWERMKQSKEIELYGRIHSDLCNVSQLLLPGVRMEIKLTKAKPEFFLLSTKADSKVKFKFLDAQLMVNRVTPNPNILKSHNVVLKSGELARYNLTRVELKTFTYSSGSKSLSIDNAVLGQMPKRVLFTMVKNTDMVGSITSNPFMFRHYDLNYFVMYVNGKQVPSGGLTLNMGHEKTSVLGYKSLFEGSGLHHSNSGLQITHDMYISGHFMLLFDLTPDHAASEGHTSNQGTGNIRIELKFANPLPDAITCLLYLEYDNSIRIDYLRNISTDYF